MCHSIKIRWKNHINQSDHNHYVCINFLQSLHVDGLSMNSAHSFTQREAS